MTGPGRKGERNSACWAKKIRGLAGDKMGSARLGAWGALLVQADLLLCGIDSARLTTDDGVDLFAFSRRTGSFGVQVKTTSPKSAKSGDYFSWHVRRDKISRADLFAFVTYHGDEAHVWYLDRSEFNRRSRPRGGPKPTRVLRMHLGGKTKFEMVEAFDQCKSCLGLQQFIDSRVAGRAKRG